MFNRFRENIAAYTLKRKLKSLKRFRKVCNLNDAKSIGILFDGNDYKNFELSKRFVNIITKSDIKVRAMGYVDEDDLDERYLIIPNFEFYLRKDLDWRLVPNNQYVQNFMNQHFDILIDLHLDHCFPLDYVAALSMAKFKVGKLKKHMNLYDLSIEIEEDQSVEYLLDQMVYYLKEINVKK